MTEGKNADDAGMRSFSVFLKHESLVSKHDDGRLFCGDFMKIDVSKIDVAIEHIESAILLVFESNFSSSYLLAHS